MLERNMQIKLAPDKWQENFAEFDVVFTCEERVFDATSTDLLNRDPASNNPVHVINVDIVDNREQAAIGGRLILALAERVLLI